MKLRNKINFVTGKNYTLAELFSDNYRIIIPDLQRDYCWGDKTHTDQKIELVSGFLHSLIEQFESSENSMLNLGLIYGYEIPQNHIQLCDGQQRLTTLYLLIGMLHKKTNGFRRYLISDFEYENDDKEPYLHYAIRESSLYFLSDLVCQFFIDKREMKVEAIRQADWYFHDYDLDPSIQSMLNALSIMEKTLADKEKTLADKEKTLADKKDKWIQTFGKWLTQQLSFMYVDMEDRRNGEETFVVINTTGEPLSATQNLKPLIIHANRNEEDVSKRWEEIETWFWQHRSNGNDTAEAGFNEFLRWVTMLHAEEEELKLILSEGTYTFPIEEIPFSEIYEYWEIVKRLSKKEFFLPQNYLSPSKGQNSKTKSISQIGSFKLLPLIAYCKQWNIAEIEDRNLLRLYHFVGNLSRVENVGKAVNELVGDVITISKTCKDIIELVDDSYNKKLSDTILSEEEKRKLNILKDKPSEREKIEEAFWEAQKHPIWSGEILPLIEWSMENGQFCIDTFVDYMNKFNAVFEVDCESDLDIVRRALLTRSLKDYPRIFRGNLNYSFGWEWSDWKELINDNKDAFKNFFNDLLQGKSTLESMIANYDESGDWAEFVHKEYLLSYCERKNIQKDDDGSWKLVKGTYATSYCRPQLLHLSAYLNDMFTDHDGKELHPNWKIWLWNGGCVVAENKSDDLVFDIYYKYGDATEWDVTFFRRNQEVEQSLKKYVDTGKWEYKDERYRIALKFEPEDRYNHPNVRQFIEEMIDKIQSQSV